MARINYFDFNGRRAHDTKGVELNFHVNMPPLLPDVNRTYDDANTLAQIMNQTSLDVGYPVGTFLISYTRPRSHTRNFIRTSRDWHLACIYFHRMQIELQWGHFTITVSLIALQGFMMVRGFPPGGPGGVFPNFGVGLGGLEGGSPSGVLHDYGVGFGGLGGGGIGHGAVPPGHGRDAPGGVPRGRLPRGRPRGRSACAHARARGGRGNDN
ncbi:hypothetical protein Tco_0032306 [Tanacetum coccineum]